MSEMGAENLEQVGGVVIARDGDHPRPGIRKPHQRLEHQPHRQERRECPVEEIPRHDHQVDLGAASHPDQLVENVLGLGGTVDTSEFLADVPVGRMKDAH